MHIYFSGIGGVGIGPLALVANEAGFNVSGSDKQDSSYIDYLRKKGLNSIHIGQSYEQIAVVHDAQPIDWLVYTSALPIENPDAPELQFCRDNNIKATKRDEFLSQLINDKQLKLIAIAGTHGKTTTTAMAVWLLSQLGEPLSYILPAKSSFAEMGSFNPDAKYFVYECDEYDRNFLSFTPHLSLITGIDWDHPDIYPTRQIYNQAFTDFISGSSKTFVWDSDATRLGLEPDTKLTIIDSQDAAISQKLSLAGQVNRQDAWLVASSLAYELKLPIDRLISLLNNFPGVSRRFEMISQGLYSDYAHTPPKIEGAIELANELASGNVVIVYEGLHNTRQHFIKDQLKHLFDSAAKIYIVPSYLAREDKSLKLLSPNDIKNLLSQSAQAKTSPAELGEELRKNISGHLADNQLVLCLSAGGGGSLDEWLRQNFN